MLEQARSAVIADVARYIASVKAIQKDRTRKRQALSMAVFQRSAPGL